MSTLTEKLILAARACGYVQKDSANLFHKYRYASAANVLAHINEAICNAGLAVVDTLPEIVDREGVGKDRVVTARMTIVVADTESGERATFRGLGSGMDSGDKAVMKAVTAATKYAWLCAFSISTGDDPEADETTDRRTAGASQTARKGPSRGEQRAEQPSARHTAHEAAEGPSARAVAPGAAETIDEPAPREVPPDLERFYARIAEIDLPGEAVAVWMSHRTVLAAMPAPDRETAWKALCSRTEEVGKMKNAKVWLKKAIQEEDERRSVAQSTEQGAA